MAELLPHFDWKWIAGSLLAIAAFVLAGLYIGSHGQQAKKAVDENTQNLQVNTDALTTICSSMTVLGIVFEQLELLDKSIASDKSLAPTVRAQVRQRASLYGIAVEGLNETNKDCEKIE